jgi:ankyrin repeat protein
MDQEDFGEIILKEFWISCKKGEVDTAAKWLHDINVDVNVQREGVSPLFVACEYGQVDVVQYLIEHDADLNLDRLGDGATPLYIASEKGHLNIVDILITGKDF